MYSGGIEVGYMAVGAAAHAALVAARSLGRGGPWVLVTRGGLRG